MSVLEEVPVPSNLAESILITLETPLNKQRNNKYLGTDDKIRNAVIDFLTVTHIAEAAVPSPNALQTFQNGIDIVRQYREDIKNELYTDKLNELHYNKNEKIKALINDIEKRGRIPLMDKVVRKRLREIKEDNTDFRKAFSDEMYILRTKGGTHLGRTDILTNHAEVFLSDDERPISELLKTEKQQQIATIEARKDEQNTFVRKQLADEMNNVESKRRKLCNNRRRKRSICGVNFDREHLKIDTESIVLDEDKIRFTLFDSRDGSFQHESEIEIKPEELVYTNFIEHLVERGQSEKSSTSSSKINRILGIYGIVAGIGAAREEFENGDNIRGSVFVSQSLYTAGNIVGLNRAAGKLFDKIGSKVLSKTAIKFGIEKVVRRLADKIASSALTRLFGSVPMIGLAFDVFFIEEDIRDLVNVDPNNMNDLAMLPLKIIHLGSDIASTILNLAGPEMEPIVLAITIFRMSFDNFYKDIYKEFKKVDWNSPWAPAEAVGAFVIGRYKAIADIFTGGLISELDNLRSEVRSNNELIRNLSRPSNYYSIETTGDSKTINFISGISSYAGGDITFRLMDNGFASIEIKGIPKRDKGTTSITKTFSIDSNLKDIILGIGESRSFTYTAKTARIFWIIPVETYHIICGEKLDRSSLHGTYFGNSKNNTFFAVQNIPNFQSKETNKCTTKYRKMDSNDVLKRYHYQLFGNDGNDVFFLGPQIASVEGGEDKDMYVVQANKGKAYINNFAHKSDTDILFFNVSFSDLSCKRINDDLWIAEGSEDRVTVDNYFKWSRGDHYKHLIFRSEDGVIFYPSSKQDYVICIATALEYSDSSEGKNINLKSDIYIYVVSVVGSPYADRIYGNSQNNILDTGGGNDFLSGGDGSDTYLIRKSGSRITDTITIDNRANDFKSDVLIIEVSFNQITLLKTGNDLKLSCSRALIILLKYWFIDNSSDHISFISGDHVMFIVAMRNGKLIKIPKTIDLSQLSNGVQLDMQNKIINGTSIPEDILPHVHTVSDSPYNDIISGNSLDNFLSCSGGNDILQGNAGMDKYVVTDKCKGLEINNYDDRKSEDMLFLFTNAAIGVIQSRNKNSLIITRNGANGIVLQNWFKDAKYRHLTLHLKAGVAALPEDPSDLTLYIEEINKDIYPPGNVTINMETFYKLHRLKRVHFTSDKITYNITGNALNNFFHLGASRTRQYIEGRNGTDTYEVDCGDGYISINNFASDLLIDHLKIGIFYDDLEISQKLDNTLIKSRKMPKHLTVEILQYCKSLQYQHLQIHTTDGVSFKIDGTCDDMHIHVLQMDMSRADSSQYVSLANSQRTKETRTVYGSLKHNNVICGNDKANKLVGGTDNDEINGNNGNDWIEGGAGNDILKGGNGDDVIFGGDGDDLIYGNDDDDVIYPGSGINTVDGGHGIDTVVLKGDTINKHGVYTNLQEGFGSSIDAENNLYISIENAIGSEFNDTLVGSDTDNLLRGYGGEDTLIPLDGNDYLFGGEAKDTFELTNATGLKTIDNYAKDQIDDIFVVHSSLGHDVCSFRYNNSLHLSFPHETTLSKRLDVIFYDWYEGSFYQHAKFQLKDTLIRGDTYLGLDDEEQTSHMLDDVTISSTYKNGGVLVSWQPAVQQLIAKGPNRVMLAYREMTKQKYTVVTIDNTTNFTITDLSNREIRLLYVRCGKVLGFTKPHHAFSFVHLSVYLECHERHRDCYITKHFKLKAVPLRRGWLLDWITNT